jgi:hypothetical protein
MLARRPARLFRAQRIPVWLKWVVIGIVLLWAGAYWRHYGPQNFLWFCDLANFLIAVGLWLESPLLLGSQAVSVLLVQAAWIVDVTGRVLFGSHPIGGTEYMFDPSIPRLLRLASLFHVATPPLLVFAIWRLGYDRRAWILQSAISWIVLPACFVLTTPAANINWVWGPFGQRQTLVAPALYLGILLVAYPVVLYLPMHVLLRKIFPEPR